MWKIWNKIFGWDYVLWQNTADNGIARIHTDKDGNAWYWRYKSTKILDPIPAKSPTVTLRFLTCPSSKYIKEKS